MGMVNKENYLEEKPYRLGSRPNRVLVNGFGRNLQLAQNVGNLIKQARPQLEIQVKLQAEPEDWQWAEAWVGVLPTTTEGKSAQLDGQPEGEIPAEAQKLSWFHLVTDGLNHAKSYLLPAQKAGAVVTHTVGNMPQYIATYVSSYVLPLLRDHHFYAQSQQESNWKPRRLILPNEIPALVIGTGAVGGEIARNLQMLGFSVVGVNSQGKHNPHSAFTKTIAFSQTSELRSALNEARLLVAALPLTSHTTNLLNNDFFALINPSSTYPSTTSTNSATNIYLPPTSNQTEQYFSWPNHRLLINVGRGQTLCPQAIRQAIDQNRVHRAILDVLEIEPLPASDWRWLDPRVVITPHISGPTVAVDGAQEFIRIWDSWVEGAPLESLPLLANLARGY